MHEIQAMIAREPIACVILLSILGGPLLQIAWALILFAIEMAGYPLGWFCRIAYRLGRRNRGGAAT